MSEFQRVVELELWSKPRSAFEPYDGKAVAVACRAATGLPNHFVLGLNFVPDPADVRNIEARLLAGEVQESEFHAFCLARQLNPDPSSELSAARFLTFVEGQALAWLHLPEAAVGKAAMHLVLAWSEQQGFIITRGSGEQAMAEASLSRLWSRVA